MAAWVNKWLVVLNPLWIWAIIGEVTPSKPLQSKTESGMVHPFHVSVIEINHNNTDKSLEISCKIFTDDFERVLAKNYKTKVDLIHPTNKAATDTLIKKYLTSHLTVRVNGKPVNFTYLGSENEEAATYGYMEVMQVSTAAKIDITTNIMYDQFDDQVNIMHVIVGGQRKSSKLNYPDKTASFSF
jgi:hypothetical protein